MNLFRISRQELHQKVWSTPISRLAKEYSLSDVGLAKLCNRHHVPRPGIGYWARIAHGQKPAQVSLPPTSDGESEIIEIVVDGKSADLEVADQFDDTKAELQRIRQSPPNANEIRSHRLKHPITLQLQKTKRDLRPDIGGLLVVHHNSPDLKVSKDAWDRAVRILDFVFVWGEQLGYKIRVDEARSTFVDVLGEDVQFGLREKVLRTERSDSSAMGHHSAFSYSKYEYTPTGILCLSIKNLYSKGARVNWIDSKSLKIEDLIGDFFEGLVEAAARLRKQKDEARDREQQWEEERKRSAVKEVIAAREQAAREKLLNDAHNWQKSQLIRDFIKARKTAEMQRSGEISDSSEVVRWLTWAKQVADELDPLGPNLTE